MQFALVSCFFVHFLECSCKLELHVSHALEPRHEISSNVVCAISKGSDQPAHMCSLIKAFASTCSLNILLLLSNFELFNLKGGCTGSSESTLSLER